MTRDLVMKMSNIYAAYPFNNQDFVWLMERKVYNFNPARHVISAGDIMVFEGGEDVSPSLYGEVNTSSSCNTQRDAAEAFALLAALNAGARIFAVCRGHQFVHAALGGKLVQDIYPGHRHIHELVGTTHLVNSYHHQGVLTPTPLFEAQEIYLSDDGVVEFYLSKPLLSVQFHPEYSQDEQYVGWFREVLMDWLHQE